MPSAAWHWKQTGPAPAATTCWRNAARKKPSKSAGSSSRSSGNLLPSITPMGWTCAFAASAPCRQKTSATRRASPCSPTITLQPQRRCFRRKTTAPTAFLKLPWVFWSIASRQIPGSCRRPPCKSAGSLRTGWNGPRPIPMPKLPTGQPSGQIPKTPVPICWPRPGFPWAPTNGPIPFGWIKPGPTVAFTGPLSWPMGRVIGT